MAAALAMHTALKRMYSVLTLQTIAHRIYTVNERTRVKREGSEDFHRNRYIFRFRIFSVILGQANSFRDLVHGIV